MAKKIYPNDSCPCGSGKKYKNCCGAPKKKPEYQRSNMALEDFVINCLDQDLVLIENLMQVLLGPSGYEYCEAHAKELEDNYRKDEFATFVKKDELKLLELRQEGQTFTKLRPYGGGSITDTEDVLSLAQKGKISCKGRQVELFHAYLLRNLERRFEQYLYLPSDEIISKGLPFGPFAHRGYDFLLGITIYIELQLGIHIFLGINNPRKDISKGKDWIKELFVIPDIELPDGMLLFLLDYYKALSEALFKYSMEDDVDLYHSINAYNLGLYNEYKKMCKPNVYPQGTECNYIKYLVRLLTATCFNYPGMYALAMMAFPQSDFVRYIVGLERAVELFEGKTEKVIDSSKYPISDEARKIAEEIGIDLNRGPTTVSLQEQYHDAVFTWMDEVNGMTCHFLPKDIKYIDFAEINEDDYTLKEGKHNINPARKTTQVPKIRKLKMELYNFLNGKCFYLKYETDSDAESDVKYIGKYPILPWISSGKEDTNHIDYWRDEGAKIDDLYSYSIERRQTYLSMEYRLTEIPVNCIEEFLNPSVFFNWKEKQDLLKEVQKQNELLENRNVQLSRHIQLNQELIRNLSHSSANYLDSENLLETGNELRVAREGEPSLETLHSRGASLILQAEQEEHLLRQLNSLVWRCAADSSYLTEQMRKGIANEGHLSIMAPINYALKTIVRRLLFREGDNRSLFIKKKLGKTDNELAKLQLSFLSDILENTEEGEKDLILWWNRNLNDLEIECSRVWSQLRIIKDMSFFDLVAEIIMELMFNALSHGDLKKQIKITLGQAEEFKGRPRWVFIQCENSVGEQYRSGRQAGITTLNESISMINSEKRGVETDTKNNNYTSKVWLLSSLLKPMQ